MSRHTRAHPTPRTKLANDRRARRRSEHRIDTPYTVSQNGFTEKKKSHLTGKHRAASRPHHGIRSIRARQREVKRRFDERCKGIPRFLRRDREFSRECNHA